VIPYLRELIKDGHEISLLTFEPGGFDDNEGNIKSRLAQQEIDWHWLRYHKRFSVLATAWDIVLATLFIRRFIAKQRPDILHGRVHVATLMGALARKLSSHKPKLLFDIRGFFPEEYTDAGVWPEGGWLYRSAKRIERWLIREADGFVVLTEKARQILFPSSQQFGYDALNRPVEVIPCCVDFSRFVSHNDNNREEVRIKLGLTDRFVVAYVGAFGGWYLTEDTGEFFGAARQRHPHAFALILTQSPPELIHRLLSKQGYGDRDVMIAKVSPSEIANYLSAADVAVSFIKRCYSKQASSPTKNAEYLACGLPIVANAGVGDVDSLIIENEVGAIVSDLSPSGYVEALSTVQNLGNISARCRRVARAQFDLESVGGERYRRIYARLLQDTLKSEYPDRKVGRIDDH
jgi:glycosyltransferase involved in cell wall biosynthesis